MTDLVWVKTSEESKNTAIQSGFTGVRIIGFPLQIWENSGSKWALSSLASDLRRDLLTTKS
ncbi:hypothetical protein [Endozoicomonas sp. 2B-B]